MVVIKYFVKQHKKHSNYYNILNKLTFLRCIVIQKFFFNLIFFINTCPVVKTKIKLF